MTSHDDYLRLMAAATRRAHELRHETGEAYWSAGTRFARDRLRSATRLAAALARHRRARGLAVEA